MPKIEKAIRDDRHTLNSHKDIFNRNFYRLISDSVDSATEINDQIVIDTGDLKKLQQIERKTVGSIKPSLKVVKTQWKR